jgi:hypothetical protein
LSELVLKFRETTLGPTSGDSGGEGPRWPPRPRDEGRSVLMLIELPCVWPLPLPATGEAEA